MLDFDIRMLSPAQKLRSRVIRKNGLILHRFRIGGSLCLKNRLRDAFVCILSTGICCEGVCRASQMCGIASA